MDVNDLTPVAQDYLKVIWSATEWGDQTITTSGLATRFATSGANVSATLRRLAELELVTYQPYRPAVLTPLGRRLAVAMVRRHRLLETFLTEVLGYGWGEVHDEAERLEHAVSDDFLQRIDTLLGNPRADPHGDPIPTPEGEWSAQAATAELEAVPSGRYQIARVSDADSAVLIDQAEVGLVPGGWVIVEGGEFFPEGGVDAPLLPSLVAGVRVFIG